jgi:hypothetical protein
VPNIPIPSEKEEKIQRILCDDAEEKVCDEELIEWIENVESVPKSVRDQFELWVKSGGVEVEVWRPWWEWGTDKRFEITGDQERKLVRDAWIRNIDLDKVERTRFEQIVSESVREKIVPQVLWASTVDLLFAYAFLMRFYNGEIGVWDEEDNETEWIDEQVEFVESFAKVSYCIANPASPVQSLDEVYNHSLDSVVQIMKVSKEDGLKQVKISFQDIAKILELDVCGKGLVRAFIHMKMIFENLITRINAQPLLVKKYRRMLKEISRINKKIEFFSCWVDELSRKDMKDASVFELIASAIAKLGIDS